MASGLLAEPGVLCTTGESSVYVQAECKHNERSLSSCSHFFFKACDSSYQTTRWLVVLDCITQIRTISVQAGDQVAYITSLHEQFIEKNLLETSSLSGPVQLPNATFRVCEPCEVEELQYFMEERSQMTVLRATLRLLEGTGSRHTSNSKNKFQIEIPPPLVGEFSEFLVELTRFQEQAMNVLKQGARIKAYMVFSNDGRSEWYYGYIASDKLGGAALDESELYTAEIIERYSVRCLKSS